MANPTSSKTSRFQKFKSPIGLIKNLWEKDRELVIRQSVIIGSLCAVFFLVFIPLSAKNHTLKTKTKELTFQIKNAQAKIKTMPELKQQAELYGKQIDSIEKRFFQLRDLDQLLGELSKFAATDNVVIMGSKPLNDKTLLLPEPYQKKYLPVSYEFTLAGDYHEFGKFINDIEQFEKLILIREITLQTSTSKNRKLQCVLQLSAFVRAPEGLK